MTAPAVTLLIPTWNAGPEFPEILGRMRDQQLERSFEILINLAPTPKVAAR